MQTEDEKSRKDSYSKYLRYSQVGIQFFVAVGLGTGGGIWLDREVFDTMPLFTLLGLALGFAAGFYSLYIDLYGRKGDRGEKKSGREGGRRSSGG